MQTEPWLQRDRAMIDQLKTLGIEKGKPYNVDARTEEALNVAAREAKVVMERRYDEGFPIINPGIRWFPAATAEVAKAAESGYADPNSYLVDLRGVSYTLGFTGIKRLGTAQFYLIANKDKDGNAFDGNSTLSPDRADQRAGQAVYDRETHTLVRNMARASVASISSGVQKNADGSVDVFFGPRAPAGKEAN